MGRVYKVKKGLECLAKVLVDAGTFIFDLIKWLFLVVFLIAWTFSAFVFISTMRFFEKRLTSSKK